jgi:3-oxoadipate enol-lactonase
MNQDTRRRQGVLAQTGDAYLLTDGARLRYRDEGQGHAVILLHGWTSDLDMWEPQMSELSACFRIIRLDRRGFGLSSGQPSLAHDLADIRALCRHLDLPQAAVLGMSQGARVALEFARASPAMISCLILDGPPQMGAAATSDVPYQHYGALARAFGMDAVRREWAQHPLVRLRTRDRRAHELLALMIGRYPGSDLIAGEAQGPELGPWTAAGIRAPVLVIAGEFDLESRRSVADELALSLPQALRVQIPGAGHLCNLDNPSFYNAVIRDFLSLHALQPTTH